MKAIIASLFFALTAATALAAPKIDSRTTTCRDVSGIVDERGSAVIYFADRQFDKFYAHAGFCDERMSHPAYLPTLDNASCFVGYSCAPTRRSPARADRGNGGISVIGASAPYHPGR